MAFKKKKGKPVLPKGIPVYPNKPLITPLPPTIKKIKFDKKKR